MTAHTDNLKVLCPFCNADQSAGVIKELDYINDGYGTCWYGSYAEITYNVKCCKCKRVIYRNEVIKI